MTPDILLAGSPVIAAAVIGVAYAAGSGRLTDCWRSLTRRETPNAADGPSPRQRAAELVRIASHGGVVAGYHDVHVERVPTGYRVTAGSVGVVYASTATAEQAITRWLTR